MTMDAKTTAKVLQLDNPDSVRTIVDSLVDGYAGRRVQGRIYYYSNDQHQFPHFMAEVLGPPLDTLPSFNYHKQGDAFPIPNHEPVLVGAMLDVPHAEMRKLGKKTADLFMPEIRAQLQLGPGQLPTIPGTDFSHIPADRLQNRHTARIEPDAGHPVRVHGNNILHKVFMLGAAAKAYMARPDAEKKKIVNTVGVLHDTDEALHKVLKKVHRALSHDPHYRDRIPNHYDNRALDTVGLSIDVDKVAETFAAHHEDFKKAYAFLFAHNGGLPKSLQQWRYHGQRVPPGGLSIDTAQDAAQVMMGLRLRMQGEPGMPDISQYAVFAQSLYDATEPRKLAYQLHMPQADALLQGLEKPALASGEKEHAAYLKLVEWHDKIVSPDWERQHQRMTQRRVHRPQYDGRQ